MIEKLTELTAIIASYAWGPLSVMLLVGTGIYLTIRLRGIQFRCLKDSYEVITGKRDTEEHAAGQVSHYQSLAAALSGTIGTGNIAGVATAITIGGPGAVFWMWITAIVGMALKFASATLAQRFRYVHPDGHVSGGPMYTLKYGLNMPRLAAAFAIFGLIACFGTGNMVQANSIVSGLGYIFPEIPNLNLYAGIVVALTIGSVILGGIRRVAKVASFVVPFMAGAYGLGAITVLVLNYEAIPAAFVTIFNLALNPWAAGGSAIGLAIQYGVARGVFASEAGLGTAAIAHAAAKTKEPVEEGFVSMIGPLIDTIIMCTLTALVIIVMGVWGDAQPAHLQGAALTAHAFSQGLSSISAGIGNLGAWVVGFGLVFFAYSTILTWSYYGDRCTEFLFGRRGILAYRLLYTAAIVLGATIPLQLVWNIADIANILMAVPNLISLILLSTLLVTLSTDYNNKRNGGKS